MNRIIAYQAYEDWEEDDADGPKKKVWCLNFYTAFDDLEDIESARRLKGQRIPPFFDKQLFVQYVLSWYASIKKDVAASAIKYCNDWTIYADKGHLICPMYLCGEPMSLCLYVSIDTNKQGMGDAPAIHIRTDLQPEERK